MSLNFQNKIVFPAPENSYTSETAYGQVIYVPRDIMKRANQRARQGYPTFKPINNDFQPLIGNQSSTEFTEKKIGNTSRKSEDDQKIMNMNNPLNNKMYLKK